MLQNVWPNPNWTQPYPLCKKTGKSYFNLFSLWQNLKWKSEQQMNCLRTIWKHPRQFFICENWQQKLRVYSLLDYQARNGSKPIINRVVTGFCRGRFIAIIVWQHASNQCRCHLVQSWRSLAIGEHSSCRYWATFAAFKLTQNFPQPIYKLSTIIKIFFGL